MPKGATVNGKILFRDAEVVTCGATKGLLRGVEWTVVVTVLVRGF